QYVLAIEDLTKCLELEPSDALCWYMRGRTNQALRRWEAAYDDLSEALKRKGDDAEWWDVRGTSPARWGGMHPPSRTTLGPSRSRRKTQCITATAQAPSPPSVATARPSPSTTKPSNWHR